MHKNRHTLWALDSNDNKLLVALELNTDTFEVLIRSMSYQSLDASTIHQIEKEWTKGEDYTFPENAEVLTRSFTDDSLLPDHIKVDGLSGAIRQLQNEWSYLLLSTKLFSQFMLELNELKVKVASLKEYSQEAFDEAKQFWEKVLEYRKEREITQEKLNGIKSEINNIFDHLRVLKEQMLKEKDETAEKINQEITQAIEAALQKIELPGVHFKSIMDELIAYKSKLVGIDLKRATKQQLFDKLNKTLDDVRAKRDDVLGNGSSERLTMLEQMYQKLKKSLEYDQKDLDYNQKKLEQTNTRLEEQLREAKIKVLNDKIVSKTERLAEIEAKIDSLKNKVNKSKNKDKESADIKVKFKEESKEMDTNNINGSDSK